MNPKEIPLSKYSMDEDVFLRADNQMSQAEVDRERPLLHGDGISRRLAVYFPTPTLDKLLALGGKGK
jgi:hypothetical protein